MRLNQTWGPQDMASHKKWERNDVANTHRERSGRSITWCKGRERKYEICKIVIDFMDNRPVLMNSSRVQILFSGLKKITAKWVKNMWKLIKGRYVRFPSVSHFALLAECLNFRALFSIATVFDHELKILLRLVLFSWRMNVGKSAAWWHKEQLWSRLLFTATFRYMIPYLFNGRLTGF